MPNTLIPIQTYTLTSTATTVSFSGIPQIYTDLKIVISARGSQATEWIDVIGKFNTSTSTYTQRYIYGTGSGTAGNSAGYSAAYLGHACGTNMLASTFSNVVIDLPNYAGSTAKSWSFESVTENSGSTNLLMVGSGLWSGTSAISSIDISLAGGYNFLSGSTFTVYGVSNGVKATGGTLTVTGGYAYHTFTTTGSFVPSQRIQGAEILAIAGGGGGGGSYAGGGGAGGLNYQSYQTLSAGTFYTAFIGSGGSGGAQNVSGTNGSNSSFGSVIAYGGGGGGTGGSASNVGLAGGSGGGAGRGAFGPAQDQLGGAPVVGQGNSGGTWSNTIQGNIGAGGGGAGAAGASQSSNGMTGGAGGIGSIGFSKWASITGTGHLEYYAGGGGGGAFTGSSAGEGGRGGGGAGGTGVSGSNGLTNTGGGGGGGGGNTSYAGGTGGSGLIIIRYPLA